MIIQTLQLLLSQLLQHAVCPLQRLLPRHAVIEKAEQHVLDHGGHEHLVVRILQDKSQLSADLGQISRNYLKSVHQDPALCL